MIDILNIVNKYIAEKLQATHLYLSDIRMRGNKIEIILDGDLNVSLNECASLSKFIHKRMETDEIDAGEYSFDIYSPGLDKVLTTNRDYKKNVGRNIQAKNRQGMMIKGQIIAAGVDKVVIKPLSKSESTVYDINELKESKVAI